MKHKLLFYFSRSYRERYLMLKAIKEVNSKIDRIDSKIRDMESKLERGYYEANRYQIH